MAKNSKFFSQIYTPNTNRRRTNQKGGFWGVFARLGTSVLRAVPKMARGIAKITPKISQVAVKHAPRIAKGIAKEALKQGAMSAADNIATSLKKKRTSGKRRRGRSTVAMHLSLK